ncbi:MAG: preprotein translocase subunit SecE [Nitrososphaeria archaeon]|nr:preprotein translocase subunit SecE [Nitrososphaeria archaeon]
MKIKALLNSMINTLRLTRKTSFEEFKLYLKLVLIGVGVVGGIGFIIKVIASFLTLGRR